MTAEKITVYEKPTCTTCRNLANLLKERGFDYERVNYFTEPLSEEKLKDLLRKAGLAPIDAARKNEPLYRELNVGERTAPGEVVKLLVAHPNLLQRPFVEIGEKAVLARPIERALTLLEEARK